MDDVREHLQIAKWTKNIVVILPTFIVRMRISRTILSVFVWYFNDTVVYAARSDMKLSWDSIL